MAKTISRKGYGQVEPNHLSAPRTGQVWAQLPANEEIELLENGMFAKYDYAKGEVNFDAEGLEPMLVYNEIKLYDDDAHMEFLKDFALKKADFVGGVMTPRLLKTNIGDLFTTNCFAENADGAEFDLELGDEVSPDANGYLSLAGNGEITFQVVKLYTMPDGQPGVKLMRTK